jgi:hypothetical protein
MATYEQTNFEQIAAAIGVQVEQVAKHENVFEAVALWYRLDRRRPTRIVPSRSREKVDRVAKNAGRLLKSLGAEVGTGVDLTHASIADCRQSRKKSAVILA